MENNSKNDEIDRVDLMKQINNELVPNFDHSMNLMNIALTYFKQLSMKPRNTNMFYNIDYEDDSSTNHVMEFLCTEMYKYGQVFYSDKIKLFEPGQLDIEKCDELYQLNLRKKKIQSQRLLSLFIYLSKLDWLNIEWSINSLKS